MSLRCVVLFVIVSGVVCSESVNSNISVLRKNNGENVGGRMLERGRTMVHHAVKRFQFLLPAIFFKLGVAFTMLILVAIASASNGVIGFMLLVVGLSAVLARFQGVSSPAVVPYHSPVVAYHRTAHDWDRADRNLVDSTTKTTVQDYSAYINQRYYTPVSNYAG